MKQKHGNKITSSLDLPGSASAGECTGMMHVPPKNDEEISSYEELFTMQAKKDADKK